ncbi:FluG domain-containing protein [Xylaria scruposa]|nr:FluG domain-containing protein [Xylaria scruposa]
MLSLAARVASKEASSRIIQRLIPLSAEQHAAHQKQLKQLYTTTTGRYVNQNDMKKLYKYHDRVLVPRFGLRRPNINNKPVLNVNSLRAILVYNIAYNTNICQLELHRLNLSSYHQILCYTRARPVELVDNKKKKPKNSSLKELFNTKAVIPAESPGGEVEKDKKDEADTSKLGKLLLRKTIGRDRLKALCYKDILIIIVRYPVIGRIIPAMSIKFVHHRKCDNKPKPTIFFFTPSKTLLFCHPLSITSLALCDDAFNADCLINARSVLKAKIPHGMNCLPLRQKESKLKIPVFRRTHRGTVFPDEAISYFKLKDNMGQQSLNAGITNARTNHSPLGNAPDAVRNQMIRHNPEFYTFQNTYLNQIANFDLQNACDKGQANLEPDPNIIALKTEREELKRGQYRIRRTKDKAKIRTLTNKIRTKRAQRKDQIVKEYRKYYFYNLPTSDLEKQAKGEDIKKYTEPAIDLVIPKRTQLAELLYYQPQKLNNEKMPQRKIKVVNLYVALGGKKKNSATRVKPTLRSESEPQHEPDPKPDPFPLLMQPTQCPKYIGNEAQTIHERTFRYCRSTERNDHFNDHHLQGKERAKQQDAFRNHIQSIHGVALRPSVQAQDRRTRKAKLRRTRRTS